MNLFDSENKSNLVHYKGKLGDFWYDPKEFEITGLIILRIIYIIVEKESQLTYQRGV